MPFIKLIYPEFNSIITRTTGKHASGIKGNRITRFIVAIERSQQITIVFVPEFNSTISRTTGKQISVILTPRKDNLINVK